MRILVAVSLVAFAVAPAIAQPSFRYLPPEAMVRHFCGAPKVSGGEEFDEVATIAERLAVADSRIHIAVANSPVVNAWDVELSADFSLICVPVALVHFLGDTEGQLAFILAHEIGHAIDDRCKSLRGRTGVADQSKAGKVLAVFFGHSSGKEPGNQRACENRADELGFNLLTRAGYNPNDAAEAFKRLSIYLGDTATGPLARLAALGNDHPITPDRIRHIRKLIAQQAQR